MIHSVGRLFRRSAARSAAATFIMGAMTLVGAQAVMHRAMPVVTATASIGLIGPDGLHRYPPPAEHVASSAGLIGPDGLHRYPPPATVGNEVAA
jgi:hypothetical protein